VIGVACAAFAAACAEPVELPAREVCDAYCGCQSPLMTLQQQCVADCEEAVAGDPIPDACVTCAREAACVELEDCFDTCFDVPEDT